MNQAEVAAILASFLMFMLALIAWVNRRHERINIAFAIFMVLKASESLIRLKLISSVTLEEYQYWMQYIFIFFNLFLLAHLYFILELTGYIHRLSEKVLFISLKAFVWVNLVFFPVIMILELFTDLMVEGYIDFGDGRFDLQWSPLIVPAMVVSLWMFIVETILFFKAYREAETPPRKTFIRLNVIGIVIIIIFSGFVSIIFPLSEIDAHFFVNFSSVIAAVIFFLAINRYQFDTIRDLNLGLAQKVEERTRHLRETQAKLVQSEKMASMSSLVAGVAHEINNPIGAISSSRETLSKAAVMLGDELKNHFGDEFEGHKRIKKLLAAINTTSNVVREGSNRISALVNRLKSFAKLGQADKQSVDINTDLKNTIGMFRHNLKPCVKIRSEFTSLPDVTCYPAKLNQLYLLFLDNANKAIDENGEILIKTELVDNSVRISFSDNGMGIAGEDLQKIFDPGFTTWGVGVGVGLSLSICYQIAEEHQGKIEVESLPGKGSTFTLIIPLNIEE